MVKCKTDISRIMELSIGFQKSSILQAAVKLDVFSQIEDKGAKLSFLAKKMRCEERGLSILLDALAGLELITKKGGKYYNSADSKKYLVKGSDSYYGYMIEFDALQWPFWGNLPESVLTGKPARRPDMFQDNEKETSKFIMGMHSIAMASGNAEHLSKKIDLKRNFD